MKNEPAFPIPVPRSAEGISRLEYFAAAALANLNLQAHISKPSSEALAQSAFNIAEAMCVEAKKRRKAIEEHERRLKDQPISGSSFLTP